MEILRRFIVRGAVADEKSALKYEKVLVAVFTHDGKFVKMKTYIVRVFKDCIYYLCAINRWIVRRGTYAGYMERVHCI